MMLGAACNYIQECSRIGWRLSGPSWDARYPFPDGPSWSSLIPAQQDIYQQECFGWVDVRDGTIGPRTYDYDNRPETVLFGPGPFSGQPKSDECSKYDRRYSNAQKVDSDGNGVADRPAWPAIGSVVRCPLFVMRRPPFAIDPSLTPNPIETDFANNPTTFGIPLLKNPDPRPIFGIPSGSLESDLWRDFSTGDREPRHDGGAYAWFRVHRDGPATFVVTCGSGASQGFTSWGEVQGAMEAARFNGDQSLFEETLRDEIRLWYRLEWSAAVDGNIARVVDRETFSQPQRHDWGVNPAYPGDPSWGNSTARINPAAMRVNQGGSIAWIQRLMAPPGVW